MIRVKKVKDVPNPIWMAEMPLAHDLCKGTGIELGAGAHNSFHLPGSINVCPWDDDPSSFDYEDFRINCDSQVSICGCYAEVDLKGEADAIPVPDRSQDYIVSSHVIEHVPDVIGAFLEWDRILKPGGIAFMIYPKRDAAALDAGRPLTTLDEFIHDYRTKATHVTHPIEPGHGRRGHYNVFSLESMVELIAWCNAHVDLNWEIVATEQSDSKVGNGHTVVARKLAPRTSGLRWMRDLGSRLFSRAGSSRKAARSVGA